MDGWMDGWTRQMGYSVYPSIKYNEYNFIETHRGTVTRRIKPVQEEE